ncbi:hypothetical protein MMC31_006441 [Peltigera leucophlebia]|nr:hypothetical protein [Peltigera leucophlebia]
MATSTDSTSRSLRLSPSTEVRVSGQFDNVGIDPQILVGKKIIACTRNSALILKFSDKTRAVLRHKGFFSCEKEFYAQPFLELDASLQRALQPLTTGNDESLLQPSTDAGIQKIGFQIKIEEAIVGQRPSVDPSVKTSHRVIGFKLQGMDRVGWVEVQSGQYYSPRGSSQMWYGYLDLVVERKPNPCSCPGSECLFPLD